MDDENHRLNSCEKWRETNNFEKTPSDFNDIYSNENDTLIRIIDEIEKVWELRFANGRMKKAPNG